MGFRLSDVTKSVFTKKHNRLRHLLVRARKDAGLTQAKLAKRLSRPQSFVSKIECGERRLDVIEFFEMAHAIGIDPYAFLKMLNDRNGSQEGNIQSENRPRRKTH
jgi:transcriptional regulator with XRE-family HTH domain